MQRDSALREQQLDEAQKVLDQFIKSQSTSLFAIAARSQLGNVIVERARNRAEKAKKLPPAGKQPLDKAGPELYTQGASLYGSGGGTAGQAEDLSGRATTKRKKPKSRRRDRYRQDFLQAQLLSAAAREEMADTLDKDSKEWTHRSYFGRRRL